MAQPFVRLFLIACLLYPWISQGAPEGTEQGEWRYWGGDEGARAIHP